MIDIGGLDATEMARLIRERTVSPVEVIDAHLARIDEVNPDLNAVVTLDPAARDLAREAERAVARGDELGPLHGVPFTAKDSFDVAGIRTTRGSRLFEDNVAEEDATAVSRLRAAGGIFLGKTNIPEFVLWAETDNLVFGPTKNPWDLTRTPGGSSGGEGAAVSAGLSPLGVGSDLSGSIRLPAHYCGIVGFKPTHGRVPLTGHWPPTLEGYSHVGPLARSVRDVRLSMGIMEGPDGSDWWAEGWGPRAAAERGSTPPRSVADLRIGWLAGEAFGPLQPEVAAAVTAAAESLTPHVRSVEPVRVPAIEDWDYDDLTMAFYGALGSPYFSALISGREDRLHPVLRTRLTHPQPTMDAFLRARGAVDRLRVETLSLFHDIDVLLCPVAPIVAPVRALDHLEIDGRTVSLRSVLRATVPFDLAGLPAVSAPFRRSEEGLPVGVQVVAGRFDDDVALDVAEILTHVEVPQI